MKRGRLLFDGGMGTMLIAGGLEPGACPEAWNQDRAQDVRAIHAAYLDAGADVITTNTFGATPSRLQGYGLGSKIGAINNTAVALAREAVAAAAGPAERFVALSVGPTGKMMPPVGTAGPGEFEAEFEGQMRSLEQPVDLVLGETFFDIREALAALGAARRFVEAPVGIGMTFNKTPRGFFTVMGDRSRDAMARLEAAGVDFLAVNCSIDSTAMVELADELRKCTQLPLLCQPNAGQPTLADGKPVYAQRPESFAADVERMFAAGVEAVGGCCGTTPEFIRRAREAIDGSK
jgi:5-methyltetrahydrofolate--homocysteine methyltransferase